MKTTWPIVALYIAAWFLGGVCTFIYEKGSISPLIIIGGIGAGIMPVVAYLHGLVSVPPTVTQPGETVSTTTDVHAETQTPAAVVGK